MKTVILLVIASGLAIHAQEKIDFAKSIKPLFESRCLECHNPKKVKGELRLDTKELALKGGESGKTIIPGKADESEMIRRISLPADHDDIMPPKGDPLTKEQIEALKKWINEGATWPDGLALGDTAAPADGKKKKEPGSEFANLTPTKDTATEQQAIQKLTSLGVSVRPVAQNLPWKEATVRPQDASKTAEALAELRKIPSLVDLNLAGLKISDKDLENLAPLSNLLRLHLENTAVTDAGIAHLKGLTNLQYLNLYNTQVGDAGLENLKGMAKLSNLYLWQSKVTDQGAANLKKLLPEANINRGEELKLLAKVEPKAEEKKDNKPAAEKKPEEKKDNKAADSGTVELKFNKATVGQVLAFYTELLDGELLLNAKVAGITDQVTLESPNKVSRGQAAEMIEKALREQAGIDLDHRITATVNPALKKAAK